MIPMADMTDGKTATKELRVADLPTISPLQVPYFGRPVATLIVLTQSGGARLLQPQVPQARASLAHILDHKGVSDEG